jgi:ubiquinone/menaquinone biosynthesis C-methylase UbiE
MRKLISNLLRQLGILFYTDKIRFYFHFIKKLNERKRFSSKNPQVKLPPSYLIYESYNLDYFKYYFDGRDSAVWLLDNLKKHIELKRINILDWGCGPARIVRHLPELLDNTCSIYGTDYNSKSIAWNRESITGVNFNLNNINPPLPYADNSFDIIYGISIFTHLSEDLHYKWFNELVRVSKNNGIIFLTLSGKAFKTKMTESERKIFDSGQLITKGKTKTGHRTYTAYHPDLFAQKLFDKHQILEHIEGDSKNGVIEQDVWIIKVTKL